MDTTAEQTQRRAGTTSRWGRIATVVFMLVLLLFAGWTVRVMVSAGESRRDLEANIGRIQQLSALQQGAARWLVDDLREPPAGWQDNAAAASLLAEEMRAESPDFTDGAESLDAALREVSRDPSAHTLGNLQSSISQLHTGLRARSTTISGELAGRWEDLLRIALGALALATLSGGLLAYANRRREQAIRLADEVAATADKLAETRAALREREALARVADELRVARDRAEAAAEAKRRFTATMSHELLTPLNIILGYAELLRERFEDDPEGEAATDVSRLDAAAQSLFRLVRQILILTEIDDPDLELSLEPLELRPLVETLVGELAPLAERQRNRVSVELSRDLMVMSDRHRLSTVLREVLDNACRFSRGEEVTIRALPSRGGVQLDVQDRGPGMTKAALGRAFDPYFQADSSSTRAHDGAGLGLTVAQRICVRLGATIELGSTRGDGTKVSIWLPAVDTSAV